MAAAFAMPGENHEAAPQAAISQQERPPPSPWARQLKQFGLFAAGAGFLAASVAVSRRAVLRRRLDTLPKFYSSNRNGIKFDASDRSAMAVQALSLATLNVMGFGIMLVGGVSWAFDLSSVEELKARTRAVTRTSGKVVSEDEEQLEQMMANLMARLGMDTKPPQPEKPVSTAGPGEGRKGA